MTTTNFARLQDRARIAAPGALDGVIRLELYDTLKEFFGRTDAWLFELPVFIVQDTNDYQVDTCQKAIVQRLMALERPRSPVPPNGPWPPGYVPMCPPQYLTVSDANNMPVESQNPSFRTRRSGVLLNAGSRCPYLRISDNPNVTETWIATLSLNISDPMDADGFERLLRSLESGAIEVIARDLTEPSPLALEVLSARPYAFLDDAPLEERRTQAVMSRRWLDPQSAADIGKLDAADGKYYDAMDQVVREIQRVLKPGGYMGLYVSDSYAKGKGFYPIGFELFGRLRARFTPVDVIAVVRHNKTLEMGNYRRAAEEGNFFLRGFNYLFIMYKEAAPGHTVRLDASVGDSTSIAAVSRTEGYYIVTARDDADAEALAKSCPYIRYGGTIVVRKRVG